jgi:hypothetical protein
VWNSRLFHEQNGLKKVVDKKEISAFIKGMIKKLSYSYYSDFAFGCLIKVFVYVKNGEIQSIESGNISFSKTHITSLPQYIQKQIAQDIEKMSCKSLQTLTH